MTDVEYEPLHRAALVMTCGDRDSVAWLLEHSREYGKTTGDVRKYLKDGIENQLKQCRIILRNPNLDLKKALDYRKRTEILEEHLRSLNNGIPFAYDGVDIPAS